MKARTYLHENKDLPVGVVKEFFRSFQAFYEEITSKMLKKFPFDDPTLQNLGNPSSRQNVSGDAVLGLAMRFGCEVQEDQLLDEYLDYQLSPDADLPSFLPDDTSSDSFWFQMEGMRVTSGNKRFQYLPLVAWAVLSLPVMQIPRGVFPWRGKYRRITETISQTAP